MSRREAGLRKLVTDVLGQCERGELSAAMALMHLLIETANVGDVQRALRGVPSNLSTARDRLSALLDENRDGCKRVASMLRHSIEPDEPVASVDEGIQRYRQVFDHAVAQNEEASVALYSLGSPALLAEATGEIVDVLERWGVVAADRDILQIGCGIGRMECALAPRVRQAVGIDVSPRMVEAAKRRCAAFPNVRVALTTGHDLGDFADQSVDLVYSVDSFPYLVQSGMSLVERHFDEAWRVLRRHGDLVILNFSYRDDGDDRADVVRLAARSGFDVLANGETPFKLWDGAAFHLRKGTQARARRRPRRGAAFARPVP